MSIIDAKNLTVKNNEERTVFRINKDGNIEVFIGEHSKGKITDGYHTFDELYYHRMILFSVICNTYKEKAWKSWLHHDGTMYNDYFIVGIETKKGQYSYHYHKDEWDNFNVKELELAPEYDGHIPSDITRLLSLLTEVN